MEKKDIIRNIIRNIMESTRKFILLDEEIKKAFHKWTCTVTYSFPDIDESFSIKIEKGIPSPISIKKTNSKRELVYTMTTETLIKSITQENGAMKAYKKGLIKYKGKLSDLLKFRKITKKMEKTLISFRKISSEAKKQVFRMIQSDKKIDLKVCAEILELEPDLIRILIYELLLEENLHGQFEDDVFIIESSIEDFIKLLDMSFAEWEYKSSSLQGKKV